MSRLKLSGVFILGLVIGGMIVPTVSSASEKFKVTKETSKYYLKKANDTTHYERMMWNSIGSLATTEYLKLEEMEKQTKILKSIENTLNKK